MLSLFTNHILLIIYTILFLLSLILLTIFNILGLIKYNLNKIDDLCYESNIWSFVFVSLIISNLSWTSKRSLTIRHKYYMLQIPNKITFQKPYLVSEVLLSSR